MVSPIASAAENPTVTAADVKGPDGIIYPLFTHAGVPGGIPNVPVVVNASDHGLPMDGKSDASVALQAALDAAASKGGGAVLIPKGRYPIDQTLTLHEDGVVLRGADREGVVLLPRFASEKAVGDSKSLISIGRSENRMRLDVALMKPVHRGQTDVPVPDASRFKVGERVVLTGLPPPDVVKALSPEGQEHIEKGTYGSVYSYQHFVIEKVTPTGLVLDRPIRLDLELNQKPFLRRADMVRGCGIENLTIAQEVERKDIHGIQFNSTADCWIQKVTMTKIGDWPVGISRSMNFEIRDSSFDESRSLGGARAYFGVSFSSDGLVENCLISRFRHLSIQLSSNGNVFRNCTIRNADINFHFHWPYENLFENCVVDATAGPDPEEKSRGSYGYGIYTPDYRGGPHNPAGPRNTFYNNSFISEWDGVMLGGGANFHSVIAYNLFDVKKSSGAVLKPGSDGTVLIGNTFILRDPLRRRPGLSYGRSDADTLTGAIIFPVGVSPSIRAEQNIFYGSPVEGIFSPENPVIDQGNKVEVPWIRKAGEARKGTVALGGTWKIQGLAQLDPAPTPEQLHPDPGISEKALSLMNPEAELAGWAEIPLPQMFSGPPVDWSKHDGEAVIRRTFDLPEALQGQDLTLSLGAVDDHDTTWINGVEVGSTQGADGWRTPRIYRVPAKLLKPKDNVIAIRIWDSFGGGGLAGIASDLWIGIPDPTDTLMVPDEIVRIKPPVASLFEWQKQK
jgi:hypothetical protein